MKKVQYVGTALALTGVLITVASAENLHWMILVGLSMLVLGVVMARPRAKEYVTEEEARALMAREEEGEDGEDAACE